MTVRRLFLSRVLWLPLLACAVVVSAQQPAPPAGAAPAQGAGAARGAGPGRGGPQTIPPGGFFFIQLSDTQFGFSNNDVDFIQDTVNAEFAVATVNRLKPAFVIVTGDLVNKPGDPAQMAEYRRITAKLDPSIPLYNVSGNHDLENEPTPASLAAYRQAVGRDFYTFRSGSLLGIVLNSTVIHTPTQVQADLDTQDRWLRAELSKPRPEGVRHVVVFQHHPYFLEKADEADQYFNVPLVRRAPLLDLFRRAGVQLLVSGHLHRSTEAVDAGLTSIVTGPVGRPLGGQSGFRVFVVTDDAITSRYYGLGEMPYRVGPAPARGQGAGRGGAASAVAPAAR